jgi:hypothetical protein
MAAQSERVVSFLNAKKRLLGGLAVAVVADAEGDESDDVAVVGVTEVGAGPAGSSVGRFVSDASEPFPMERRLLLKTASRFINAHKHKRQW